MDINRLAEVLEEVVKRLDQTSHVMERLDALQNYIDEVKDKLERLDRKTDFIKTQIVEIRDRSSNEVEIKNGRKLQGDIEQVKTSITSIAGHLDTVEKSLKNGHKTVKKDLFSLKQGQDLVTTKLERSTNEVKDDIYRSKRDILAVTEKEAQIVRDSIKGPLPSLGKYSFDFYVENFKTLVRSGKYVYSPPWHINEAKTSMAGLVKFKTDGNIEVVFIHARHSREVGLQPGPALDFKVKATICDARSKILSNIVVGDLTDHLDETGICHNGDWGWPLGAMSGDDLIKKGYGQKEGYLQEAILVRYDVIVL